MGCSCWNQEEWNFNDWKMKAKKIFYGILLSLFLGITVTSCTQNDGYIGPIFGKWQLTEMWKGETVTPHDSIYYNFQTSVILVQLVHRYGIENSTENYYGNFEKDDTTLKFAITEPSWTSTQLPAVLNLEPMGLDHVNVFHIEKLTSSQMILTRGTDERFVFRKF